MNETDQIEEVLNIMSQLKQLEKKMHLNVEDQGQIIMTVLALIAITEVPDVQLINPTIDMAFA